MYGRCCLCFEEARCSVCWLQGGSCSGHLLHREAAMMKGTVMFASLLVTGESLTCTGSDDPSASVPFCSTAPTWEKRSM